MFHYTSQQQHSTIINGKESTRINSVEIHGKKGSKTVVLRETGKSPRKKTMRLKRGEIECIRHCKFIPGLFKDCEKCLTRRSRSRRAL